MYNLSSSSIIDSHIQVQELALIHESELCEE